MQLRQDYPMINCGQCIVLNQYVYTGLNGCCICWYNVSTCNIVFIVKTHTCTLHVTHIHAPYTLHNINTLTIQCYTCRNVVHYAETCTLHRQTGWPGIHVVTTLN